MKGLRGGSDWKEAERLFYVATGSNRRKDVEEICIVMFSQCVD